MSEVKYTHNTEVESNTARLVMWYSGINVVGQHFWLGSGTGSVKEVLQQYNMTLDNTGVAAKKLDAHNQFLNCAIELGIVGLVLFLIPIVQFMGYSIVLRNWRALLMSASFVLTMLFESFLETQAGIVPYCILTCIFVSMFDDQR